MKKKIGENLSTDTSNNFSSLTRKLAEMTGLEINPKKSKVLLVGENHSHEFLNAITKMGQIVDIVDHLGIKISTSFSESRDKTFSTLIEKITTRAKTLQGNIAASDMFLRKNIVASTLSPMLNHAYRVFPPSNSTLKEIWKIIRKAMWTSRPEEIERTWTKIAEKRISASISKGGLG